MRRAPVIFRISLTICYTLKTNQRVPTIYNNICAQFFIRLAIHKLNKFCVISCSNFFLIFLQYIIFDCFNTKIPSQIHKKKSQNCKMSFSSAQLSSIQFSIEQCSYKQCSAVQCSAVQFSTLVPLYGL